MQGQTRHKNLSGLEVREDLGWGGLGSHPCAGSVKTEQDTGRAGGQTRIRAYAVPGAGPA